MLVIHSCEVCHVFYAHHVELATILAIIFLRVEEISRDYRSSAFCITREMFPGTSQHSARSQGVQFFVARN